jgi:hypothetical protein
MAKMKRSSSQIPSRNTCAKRPRSSRSPNAPSSTAPTRSRASLKKPCAATAWPTPWSAASPSTSAPKSRTSSAISSSRRTRTTRLPCSASSTRPPAASARQRWRLWSASPSKPAPASGRRSAARSRTSCCLPARSPHSTASSASSPTLAPCSRQVSPIN